MKKKTIMKRGIGGGVLTMMALTAVWGSARVSAADVDPQERDFTWTGRLEPGATLEVRGVNGKVVAGLAEDDQVEVRARKRGRDSDPDGVRIEVVEHDGGVTICAVYPTPAGERPNVCAPDGEGRMNTSDNDVRVDFEVRVPAGVRFRGATVNGDVEARGLRAYARVHTVNGDVRVSTAGAARASTVNGSIEARMGRVGRDDEVSFSTVNGSIEVDLPDDVDADVEAKWVNGGLESDLPFTLRGRLSRHRAEGVLGDGGARLALKTVNGSIRIY